MISTIKRLFKIKGDPITKERIRLLISNDASLLYIKKINSENEENLVKLRDNLKILTS